MRTRRLPLFWSVFLVNGLVFALGTLALVLAPVQVSRNAAASETLVLAVGLGAILVLNAVLLRIALSPVDRVSKAKVLAGQESERQRIAQELHDEVGQNLTVVLLALKRVEAKVAPDVAGELAAIRETTRQGLDDVRRLVDRLRPGALEDLGLASALEALAEELSAAAHVGVDCVIDADLPPLTSEQELVVFRVAQEALTNIARHAHAGHASLSLTARAGVVTLEVVDDGQGRGVLTPSAGIAGMQERALLVGAELSARTREPHGVEVVLRLRAPGGGR